MRLLMQCRKRRPLISVGWFAIGRSDETHCDGAAEYLSKMLDWCALRLVREHVPTGGLKVRLSSL